MHINKFGVKVFNGYGQNSYIDAECINRSVGFIKIENIFYILDKENQVIYE